MSEELVSPIINKEGFHTDWGFTCPKCYYIPPRDVEPEWVMVGRRYEERYINPGFPERCTECERMKKRVQRMKKRLRPLWDLSFLCGGRYKVPKLVTFPLLTRHTFLSDSNQDMKCLRSKLPEALGVLQKKWGVLGGVIAFENVTTSYLEDDWLFSPVYRHHVHVHCVMIGPFIPARVLPEFSASLMDLGFGRINYRAPNNYWHVASYISKYITKENYRCKITGPYQAIIRQGLLKLLPFPLLFLIQNNLLPEQLLSSS